MNISSWPRLVGDIGGTNARFALDDGGALREVRVLRGVDHPTLQDAIRRYLHEVGAVVRDAAIGIANPVYGDAVRMTNHHWQFSIDAARAELGLRHFLVINDFAALALALPHIPADELHRIGGGVADASAPRGLLGAGTGLGVGALIAAGDGHFEAIAGEGGHVSFSPGNDDEAALWRHAHARFGHVSAERVLSGPGLELIHDWLRQGRYPDTPVLDAARICERGLHGGDAACRQTLEVFCRILGSAAADVALTFGARGGMYIGGGIVPRLGSFVDASDFRARFEAKGRMAALLATIPVFVIHSAQPALLGAASHLATHLERQHHA